MAHPADFLSYLGGISLRAIGIASLAGLALWTFRVRSASHKHAVWTVVVMGMLIQAVAAFTLPSLPLRVLRPASADTATANGIPPAFPPNPVLPASHTAARISWSALAIGVYASVALALLGR